MEHDKKMTKRKRPQREPQEFDQQIVDMARVTRVTEGGKQLSFRVCIVIGDRKGRVGYGIAKGNDVQIAVQKAVRQAQKNVIRIPLVNESIPHRVQAKYKAAKIMMKPAPRGSGIIAGGATRTILELAGVPNASAKTLGKTGNKVTNVKATFEALTTFLPRAIAKAKIAAPKKEVQNKEAFVKESAKKAPRKVSAKKTVKKEESAAQ